MMKVTLCLAVVLVVAASVSATPSTVITVHPKLVSASIGDTGYYLYRFCHVLEHSVTHSFDVKMKFNWLSHDSNDRRVIIDWDHNGRGADFRDYNLQHPIEVSSSTDSLPEWLRGERVEVSGLIITNTLISSIEITVGVKSMHNYECKACDGEVDWCGVCRGDHSTCSYPVGCDGMPLGATDCSDNSQWFRDSYKKPDNNFKDTKPVKDQPEEEEDSNCGTRMAALMSGDGVTFTVALFALLPVLLACACTAMCLAIDKKKRKSKQFTVKDVEAAEPMCQDMRTGKSSVCEAPVQPVSPQPIEYVTNGGLVVDGNGIPLVYPVTYAEDGSLVAGAPVAMKL